jgi:large subunit ribosomal protein L3
VFKNKKMAGHMGDRQRTQQNLMVVRTDAGRGLIFVRGSVPGAKNGWLLIRDAVKLPVPEGVPFPGAMRRNADETASEDAPAGMVEEAAIVEVDTGPTTEEAAAMLAEADVKIAEQEVEAAEEAAAADAPASDADSEKKEG